MIRTISDWLGRMLDNARRFRDGNSGTSAVAFAVTLPTMIAVGGFAADYTSMSSNQNRLQQIIDAAALSIAREMTISPVTSDRAQQMAAKFVSANIPANTPFKVAVAASLVESNMAVRVEGTQQFATPFGTFERFVGENQMKAVAVARPAGVAEQMKLCVLSLAKTANSSINLRNGSRMTANGCMIQSNSTARRAVTLGEASVMKATTLCARGGIQNIGSSVEGNLVTDCPEMKDPLASKPEPKYSPLCKVVPAKINKGIYTLDPGTYCGGLSIFGTAQVKLNPGLYIFKDGPLRVWNSAELKGDGVTLAFAGNSAYFRFEQNSLIELTAPTSGDTAGMLIWEVAAIAGDPEIPGTSMSLAMPKTAVVTPSTAPPKDTSQHRIASDRARVLTGTIYLKKGLLTIDATKPVADQSPFTILVVNQMDLYDGPHLVLNSNYANSPVPVPFGLGPIGNQKVHLGK